MVLQEMAETLRLDLQELYLKTCLPALDSLSFRHRAKLGELGVPGLGGDVFDEKGKMRIRRIMDVIEAALED
jgi:hypothetical protein